METRKSDQWEISTSASRHGQTDPPGRILLLDADPCLCEFNAEALRRHGFVANTAPDAETGWEKLQTNRYNLLIAENDLPGLTGVGLIKELHSACMFLPIIIVIGTLPTWKSADYPWLLKATKLFKPYAVEDLLGQVKCLLPKTAGVRAQLLPAQDWQSHPYANRLRV